MNSVIHNTPWMLCSLMFLLGSCVGSFLNVLSLRTLKEESIIFPGSYCPACKHALSAWDNIPIISFLLLKGKCRYCAGKISCQYPLVELTTGLTYAALSFVFLVIPIPVYEFSPGTGFWQNFSHPSDLLSSIQHARQILNSGQTLAPALPSLDQESLGFYKYGLFAGMLALSSTLIAVTITDIREKLIPHEITYPSMIIGLIFSTLVRGDFVGAMVGIGASYIIFDFLAFYGLKVYLLSRKNESSSADEDTADSKQEEPTGTQEEPVEVMGGGDAVLSAVMAAYLGWQALVLALVTGFIAGTVMGLVLLIMEIRKAGLLKECSRNALKWALGCGLFFCALMSSIPLLFARLDEIDFRSVLFPALYLFTLGAGSGALIGIVKVGTRVSKPFPFGPALALGGFVAMFLIPYWLPGY